MLKTWAIVDTTGNYLIRPDGTVWLFKTRSDAVAKNRTPKGGTRGKIVRVVIQTA